MAEFTARVSIGGVRDAPTDGVFSVTGEALSLSISGHVVGTWPIADSSPRREGDRFHLSVEGESLVVDVTDPGGFARALWLDAVDPVHSTRSEERREESAPTDAPRRRGRHVAQRDDRARWRRTWAREPS
jgi:hypothetical protein